MDKVKLLDGSIHLSLSSDDTYAWAHKTGASWPCSTVSGYGIDVELAPNGDLVDLTVSDDKGRFADRDIPSGELNAIVSDFLAV